MAGAGRLGDRKHLVALQEQQLVQARLMGAQLRRGLVVADHRVLVRPDRPWLLSALGASCTKRRCSRLVLVTPRQRSVRTTVSHTKVA